MMRNFIDLLVSLAKLLIKFLSLEMKLLVDKKLENISGFTLPHPKFYPHMVWCLIYRCLLNLFNIDDPQNFFFKTFNELLVFFTGSIFFYKFFLFL